ncbi:MAG UNVERIFIED_CONTAM: hypothetical protein LVR18_01375 [Planctomycetaceae bacterium]
MLSIPGRIGGFELAKDPSEITMGQVVRHFDGVLAHPLRLHFPLRTLLTGRRLPLSTRHAGYPQLRLSNDGFRDSRQSLRRQHRPPRRGLLTRNDIW